MTTFVISATVVTDEETDRGIAGAVLSAAVQKLVELGVPASFTMSNPDDDTDQGEDDTTP